MGVGGGFLVVPLLLLVYNLSPPAAAATSLVVVFLNSASGTLTYLRRRRVDVMTGLLLAVATIPGAMTGPWIAEQIPARAFKIGFGLFLLGAATLLFFKPERRADAQQTLLGGRRWRMRRRFVEPGGAVHDYSFNVPLALGISLLVGALSSMLGIGGGVVHVPAMIHLMAFPVHLATATSQFVLAITSAVGVAEYAARDRVVWSIAIPIGAGVILGAQLGAALSERTKGSRIVRLLVIAVLVLGVRLIWAGVSGD